MVSRSRQLPARAGSRPRGSSHPFQVPRRPQRALFSLSLVAFAVATGWTALILFARIYPALFPGQVLTEILPGGGTLARVPVVPVQGAAEGSAFNDRITLLVIGVDRRPQESEEDPPRTDTLMVATIDPVTKQAAALSLPRDLYIDHHLANGYTFKGRINESYAIGWDEGGGSPDAGADQLARDLRENFGISIDHYLLLDFRGVERLIDSLGGIDIEIPEELAVPEWRYSDDDETNIWVEFPPGPQHLDGYHAVAFGRYRDDPAGDLVRVKRQQLVLNTALEAVFTGGIIDQNPFDLWDAYASTVKTDIPRANMPGYILLLKETGGDIQTFSLGDQVDGRDAVWSVLTDDGASVLDWDPELVNFWLLQVFANGEYAGSNVEVRGGYGSWDGGLLTGEVGRLLHYRHGLPSVFLAGDVPAQDDTTITVYSPARRQMAEDIAAWLGLPETTIHPQPKPFDHAVPDIVVVVGADFELPDF